MNSGKVQTKKIPLPTGFFNQPTNTKQGSIMHQVSTIKNQDTPKVFGHLYIAIFSNGTVKQARMVTGKGLAKLALIFGVVLGDMAGGI